MKTQFRLLIAISVLLALPLLWSASGNAQDVSSTFTDLNGRYTFAMPADWIDESTTDFNVFRNEENIYIYLVAVSAGNVDEGIDAALNITHPELNSEPVQTTTANAPNGTWTQKVYISEDASMTVAVGQLVDDAAYVLILQAPDEASVQAASDDFTSTLLSFTIGTTLDLTNVRSQPITPDMLADLENYVESISTFYEVPGAAVAIVQGGEIIYSQGFGVVETGTEQAVTTDTLFMIGSIGKSMTTMMMGSLVDDGILSWDTPARAVFPNFSLSNEDTADQIRIRDFVNNMSGVSTYNVPRYLVNQTPEQVIESLATVPMIALPGEAYSYSNLMFAVGGYAAARTVADSDGTDLHGAYTTLMQKRIFDPIGMSNTTFDFDAAISDENHALPHTFDVVARNLDVIPIDWEQFLVPVAPAGAAWSNIEDMALYLTTQLNRGITPYGTVIVSEANLSETQKAGISIAGDIYYGMGWVIDAYNGIPLIWHNGGTQGFTSDIAFLPDADLGVIVLSNIGNVHNFTRSIREYVFELSFGLSHDGDSRYRAVQSASDAALAELLQNIEFVAVDEDRVRAYVGEYDMGIAIHYDATDGFMLATDYGDISLVAVIGMQETFYARNGLILTFSQDSEDAVTLSIGMLDDPLQTLVLHKRVE
ncbi:MAG: hypothetical protein CL607_24135 [Anaerolineaceae bacterium]|nr:hypothetical protein [Anaerolineaceae bacterium]